MVEISDVVRCRAKPISLVDDELRFVVQPLDGAVVYRHPKVVEDIVFVATHHPGEVAHRGEESPTRTTS